MWLISDLMKMKREYTTLIAIIIVLILLVLGFSYFSKFSFKLPSTTTPPTTTGEGETGGAAEIPPVVAPQQKTFSFYSATCTIAGSVDIVKFKIQTGEFGIGVGEMAAFLDDTSATSCFKDSQGNKINAIQLNANSVSDEFSCTTDSHLPSRKIAVSSPAGALEQSVTCS